MSNTKEIVFAFARKAVLEFPKMVAIEDPALASLSSQTIWLHLREFNLQNGERVGIKNKGGTMFFRKRRSIFTISEILEDLVKVLKTGSPVTYRANTINIPSLRVQVCNFNKENRASLTVKTQRDEEGEKSIVVMPSPELPIIQPAKAFKIVLFPDRIRAECLKLYRKEAPPYSVYISLTEAQREYFLEILNAQSLSAVENGFPAMEHVFDDSGATVRLVGSPAGGNDIGLIDWPIEDKPLI